MKTLDNQKYTVIEMNISEHIEWEKQFPTRIVLRTWCFPKRLLEVIETDLVLYAKQGAEIPEDLAAFCIEKHETVEQYANYCAEEGWLFLWGEKPTELSLADAYITIKKRKED